MRRDSNQCKTCVRLLPVFILVLVSLASAASDLEPDSGSPVDILDSKLSNFVGLHADALHHEVTGKRRQVRQATQNDGGEERGGNLELDETSAEEEGSGEPAEPKKEKKESSVSLGKILGILFLVCVILYLIGIAWKIFKVYKGTYVEEEPVFLKYK